MGRLREQPLVTVEEESQAHAEPGGGQGPPWERSAPPSSGRLPQSRGGLEGWMAEIRPRLVGLAWRFLWNRDDAEEVVQEALLLAWRHLPRLRDERKRNAWAIRTTINLCMNCRRRRRTASGLAGSPARRGQDACPPEPPAPPQADPAETGELTDRLRIAVDQLPERQQAALVLRELEGMEYEQIAAIMKAQPGAVRVLVHRARESLRQTLLRQWPDSFGP